MEEFREDNLRSEAVQKLLRQRMEREQRGDVVWRRMLLAFSFLLPLVIMLTIFILREIYPFGDRSFLFSDMWHQYMPFFQEFLHKIKAGEGLSYTYQVGIGSNFLALYVYYLASPLNWLAFLVPESHLMEFMSYLVVFRVGLCGLTFFYYLREHFGHADVEALFFACFYAHSGFMAAYNWDIMWLDCVVLLPLILLGLEKLVKEGKCGLYCISLGLSILTNYYISIMICIFLVLYFLALFLVEKNPDGWRGVFRRIGNFALYSLLAGGMAGVLLVPEVLAILETDFGDMDFPKKVESYFSVLDMLARHCTAVMTERGLDHWPNIYCGAAVFLLLPLYAVCRKIPARRRFGYLCLAGLLLVSFSTNVLDFIWHGMNYPDSLPARQSFIYIFLILIMCYAAYRQLDAIPKEHVLYAYLGAVVCILMVEKFVEHEDFMLGVEFLTLAFVTAYAILLYLRRIHNVMNWKEILAVVTLVFVMAEAGINTFATSVGTTSRSQYLDPLPDYQALYEIAGQRALAAARAEDPQGTEQVFFRMEKFSRRSKNDGTLAGYPTASVFSSTMNSYVMDLYKRWGMRHSKVYYAYDGATFFTSALLNVSYLYGEKEQKEGPLYQLITSSGDVSLYEVKETLPFGYVAPPGYEMNSGFVNDGLRQQNNMVQRLGIEGDLFAKTSEGGKGTSLSVEAEVPGYYYGIVTAYGTGKIKVSGSLSRSLDDLKYGSVLYLGFLEEGDTVTLENGDESDTSPEISVDVYRMDPEILSQALAVLRKDHLTHVTYDSTHVKGEIDLEEAGKLILSIPLEKGWTVELDGSVVEPETFGDILIALELEAGHHTISMHYVPHGKYAGIAVSAVSFLILAGIVLWKKRPERWRKTRRRPETEEEDDLELSEDVEEYGALELSEDVGENGALESEEDVEEDALESGEAWEEDGALESGEAWEEDALELSEDMEEEDALESGAAEAFWLETETEQEEVREREEEPEDFGEDGEDGREGSEPGGEDGGNGPDRSGQDGGNGPDCGGQDDGNGPDCGGQDGGNGPDCGGQDDGNGPDCGGEDGGNRPDRGGRSGGEDR